jgi:hypothetical protein
MTCEKKIAALAYAVARTFPECFTPNCCLNGTRVVVDALRELELKARPISVDVRGFAPHARYSFALDTVPKPDDDEHDVWAGHLVALVEGQWLFDSSAIQFDRPQHSLLVPPVFIGKFNPKKRDFQMYELKSGVLGYRVRPYDTSYLSKPGWQPHEFNALVKERITALAKLAIEQSGEV